MNKFTWIVLVVTALFSGHIHSYFVNHAKLTWILLYFENFRYLSVALYSIAGTLISALATVSVFGVLVKGKENLVPGLLAVIPFVWVASAYIERYVLLNNHAPFTALVLGLPMLAIPVLYLVSYRLAQYLRELLTSKGNPTRKDARLL